MDIQTIGKQIAAMRKEREIRQEELARYVGVSTQAVSKWENGGVPDTELLPKIADFFSVSVDSLFGRDFFDYGNLRTALIQSIVQLPQKEKIKALFEICWDMERAMMCDKIPDDGSVADYEKNLDKQDQRYSSIISDYGFTRMGIANRLQYFLLVPEIKNADTAFLNGTDYSGFFKVLSDELVFEACMLLYKRKNDSSFTKSFLMNHLHIDKDKATQIIGSLIKCNLLQKMQIDTDSGMQTVYRFNPTPSFIALLIFAREMIQPPNNFCYYSMERTNPYLK